MTPRSMSLCRMIPLYRRQWVRLEGVLSEIPVRKDRLRELAERRMEKINFQAPVNSAQGVSKTGNTLLAGLGDALDAQNTGNFLDIGKDGFKLTFVGDFGIGVK